MAQSPLSQQIRALESELGGPLLRRTTRRVELTPAGTVLLGRARALLASADSAAEETARAMRGEVGRLSIGFTGTTTYALLPPVAAGLREVLPGVKLELHGEMMTPAQVAGLLDGSLDLGILRPPVRSARLEVQVVRSEPMIAVLPADHPLAGRQKVRVADLAEEAFVRYAAHQRSVVDELVRDTCERAGFVPRLALEVTETATLVSFVAAGIGVALLPESVSGIRINGAVYRPLRGTPPRIEIALAWRADDASPVLARALRVVRARTRRAPNGEF